MGVECANRWVFAQRTDSIYSLMYKFSSIYSYVHIDSLGGVVCAARQRWVIVLRLCCYFFLVIVLCAVVGYL